MSCEIVKDEVVFKDGHKEEVTFYEREAENRIYFRTETAEYRFAEYENGECYFGKYNLDHNAFLVCDDVKYLVLRPEPDGDSIIYYEPIFTAPRILDSGNRREFETGAVRDIQEGKGRCDLMPLDVVAGLTNNDVLRYIYEFQFYNDTIRLEMALKEFVEKYTSWCNDLSFARQGFANMCLEVAKHFEEGAKKYGENNWQKGIPVHCYIDSAVRHYLKFLRGDTDEPHDRAFCWNIMCCIWTCRHKPELNDYRPKNSKDN